MYSVEIPKKQEMTNASQENGIWNRSYNTFNAVLDYLVSLSSFSGSRITSPTCKTSSVCTKSDDFLQKQT